MRILGFCIVLMLVCSCQKNEPAANVASDNVTADVSEQPTESMNLPFGIEVIERETDADGIVTLELRIKSTSVMQTAPVLMLQPGENSVLVDTPEITQLDALMQQTQMVQTVRLSGSDPSLVASVRLTGKGFGIEVHESWPKSRAVQSAEVDSRIELPAPIVVEGQTITRGVEVKP